MWKIKKLDDLSVPEFYAILKLRIDTFVVAQNRIYHELDEIDKEALHIFFISEQKNEVLAYARVFDKEDHISFGRIVTSEKVRGQGYGAEIVEKIMALCDKKWSNIPIEIEAQEQVVKFYEKFGFKKVGHPFIFAGSPHVEMRYTYDKS